MIINRILMRKMLRELWLRKGALLALVLIVTVGVGSYVGMAAVYQDMESTRQAYYSAQRLADFTVDLKRVPAWAVAQLNAVPNIETVQGRVHLAVMIDLPGLEEPLSGRALSLPEIRRPVLNDIRMVHGGWFSGADKHEVILNNDFAKAHGLLPGDRIKVLLLDRQYSLLIVGTAMSPEFVYLLPPGGGMAPDPEHFGVMYLPTEFLRKSCDLQGAYNQVIGHVDDKSHLALENTLRLLEEILDPYGVTNTTPVYQQVSVRFLQDELTGLQITSTMMPSIFLAVAVLVLNILMSRLVMQQRPVIGTLKALGYSRGAIIRHYLAFGLAVGLAGGLAGVLFGQWMQAGALQMYKAIYALPLGQPHFYPRICLIAMTISVGCALLGTLKGVWAAARLAPATAMAPPPPEKGNRVLPERIPFIWQRLPFRWKMILRAVFRNPFRSTVSILAATVATVLIIAALSINDSLVYLMHYQFECIVHQDMTVSLRDPCGYRAITEMRGLTSVAATEGQLNVICDLSYGPHRKRVGVLGLGTRRQLYTPLDRQGRPIQMPSQGVLLDTKLAEILHVRPGNVIHLRPLIAQRRQVSAPVLGLVDTFLGLSAYMDRAYLSRLLGEDGVTNSLLLANFQGRPVSPLLRSLKKRPAVIGISRRPNALEQMEKTFGQMMGTMINIMVFFAGLIAFGSVLNAALVSLSERQREVGSLRVLGYSPAQISYIFSGESFLLNFVGILLGLLAGIGCAEAMAMAYNTELYRFPAIVHPSRLGLSMLLMGIFVCLAQGIIYRLIRRMDWLQVLKVKE